MDSIEDLKNARRRRIAEEISDALVEAGLSRKEFAALMHRQASEVTRWLSGTHNFTSDLLAEISAVLARPISGVEEMPVPLSFSSAVDGYDAAAGPTKSGRMLGEQSAVMLNISLPGEVAATLSSRAASSGKTFREYVSSLLCNSAEERRPCAADFCGIWDGSFPDYEEIRGARTTNSFPEL